MMVKEERNGNYSNNNAVKRVIQGKKQNLTFPQTFETLSRFLHSSHQVTQEEFLICPSHAAVSANYSDLKCALVAIGGDARCHCINLLAPAVVS